MLNVFAFLLASWLYAHGISISRNQDFVRISALHTYFLPQLLIFFGDLCLYFLWWRRRVQPQETSNFESGFQPLSKLSRPTE